MQDDAECTVAIRLTSLFWVLAPPVHACCKLSRRFYDRYTCNGPNGDPNFHGGIQLNPFNEPWMLLNSTMIDLYVQYSTACVLKHGFDGMTLDIENLPWPVGPSKF